MCGLAGRRLGALLALASGAARGNPMQDFVDGCTTEHSPPSGSQCEYESDFACCPTTAPYSTWRQRQAVEPLLLKRVLRLHPLLPSEGVTASSHPPLVGQSSFRLAAGLTVLRLFGVDQKSQRISMHYKLRLMWRDCRLLHNCSWIEMSGQHPLYHELWNPSSLIDEQESNDGYMMKDVAAISPDGVVSLSLERVGSFRCKFDFTSIPFDSQSCHLTLIMPSTRDGTTLDLVPMLGSNGEAAFLENIGNAEWEIDSQWTVKNVEIVREQHNGRRPMKVLRWSFVMNRRSHAMATKFIYPTFLYYLVSWMGLWIDPQAVPARIAAGVIPVLIMTNKLGSLESAMPPIGHSCKLENFIIATLTFIVLQMLEFGFVNFGRRRQAADAQRKAETRVKVQQVSPADGEEDMADKIEESISQSIKMADRITAACARDVDTHFRWISILAYSITSLAILVS